MTLEEGMSITLGTVQYDVGESLSRGVGAVSDVYAADAQGYRVALKLLRDEYQPGDPQAEGLRREGTVLTKLNGAEEPRFRGLKGFLERAGLAKETAGKRGIVAVIACDRFTCLDSHLRYSGPVHELAFHRALLAQHVGRNVPVHIIAVEKEILHRCSVWVISERLLRRARKENEKALAQLQECRRLNRWPTGYEGVRKLAPIGI